MSKNSIKKFSSILKKESEDMPSFTFMTGTGLVQQESHALIKAIQHEFPDTTLQLITDAIMYSDLALRKDEHYQAFTDLIFDNVARGTYCYNMIMKTMIHDIFFPDKNDDDDDDKSFY